MDLRPIDTSRFTDAVLSDLQACENQLRFDGDHDPLYALRSLITALDGANAWRNRHVRTSPEGGRISDGLHVKVSIVEGTYVTCHIDSVESLLGEADWSWGNVAEGVTDALNAQIHTVREALLAPVGAR
ncbi:MAG: hypothetical protein DI630_13245 [Gordonia sp. (in: high G+C Gram-positive bacteria)]|nr:MAG: hypothetical protein DI630_13245 [Gordonia sp. (in: high G+C Gram-positive bacteria)]